MPLSPTSMSAARASTSTLKKDRQRTSVEFERALAPQLNRDRRRPRLLPVAAGRRQRPRHHDHARRRRSGAARTAPRSSIVEQMRDLPELVAPRVSGDLQRPEITITPRLDLAADLGVTTAALSQTIRIATLGDIDQNSAKFSLSDRQIPIRVALAEDARQQPRRRSRICRCRPRRGGSVPLQRRRRRQLRRRPDRDPPLQPGAAHHRSAPISRPAWSPARRCRRSTQLPTHAASADRRAASSASATVKWQAEMLIRTSSSRSSPASCWCSRCWSCSTAALLPPLVNMGSLLLAPLGGADRAAHRRLCRCRCRCSSAC